MRVIRSTRPALAALLLATAATVASAERAERAEEGARLYHDYCSVCHGDRGDGRSRAQGSMQPPPRDFTSTAQAEALTRERMIRSVTAGRPGTAMAPWARQLSPAQVEAVVDYIRERFMALGDSRIARGARLYGRTCSVCHGDDGSGARWTTTNMSPAPRDFTSEQAALELSRERMLHAATYGRPDTAMPGFRTQLSAADIEAVVDHIRSQFMRPQVTAGAGNTHGETAGGGHDHDPAAATAGDGLRADFGAPFGAGLVGDAKRGEAYYRINCEACHGEQGNGRGPRAYFILPKPRNFTHPAARSSLNRPHLFEAIARGSLGTEMPAWDTVLDSQQIADIAEYVLRRFVRPGQAVATRAGQ